VIQSKTTAAMQSDIEPCPNRKGMVISIHDVAPEHDEAVREFVTQLKPRVGYIISAAVVPAGFRNQPSATFAEFVQNHCSELALHGYEHTTSCRFHPLAFLSHNSCEFIDLQPSELRERITLGQELLREHFGRTAAVLVPPAWCSGSITPELAAECGLQLIAGLHSLTSTSLKMALAVYSWDWGRAGRFGVLGEVLGAIQLKLGACVPCVVLHPSDISRSLFRRALAKIDHFLRDGYVPMTFAELASEALATKQVNLVSR
jgi:predicted deacetylase